MPSREEITDLCFKLRGEKLVTEAEKSVLTELNIEVEQLRKALQSHAWICRHQQLDLTRLAVYSDPDFPPTSACQRATELSLTSPLESYKRLGASDALVADLIRFWVDNRLAVAELLRHGGNFEGSTLMDLVQMAYTSLYGSCIIPKDEKCVLEVLGYLIPLQILPDANPRRLLRKGRCGFSRLYKLFSEGLHSAKLFLTAALHDSVMFVLSQDELFLDIDPGKAAVRFPPAERARRFGEEGSENYRANLERYRQIIVNKLVSMTAKFIHGIRDALHCFPPCLSWLVRQLYEQLLSSGNTSKEEAMMICTDLVFTLFICPAITNPEPLGIIGDVPISYIARFNLMQVGQILQVLAVFQYEVVDPKLMDLYGRFEPNCMSGVIDGVLSGDKIELDDLYLESSDSGQLLDRTVVLIQLPELNSLLGFLKSVQNHKWMSDDSQAAVLAKLLERLPETFEIESNQKTLTRTMSPPGAGRGSKLPQGKQGSKGSNRLFLSPDGKHGSHPPLANGFSSAVELLSIPIRDSNPPLGLEAEETILMLFRNAKRDPKLSSFRGGAGDADGIVIQEKRTRFSLSQSHDLESVGTSDNLENEMCSNQSVCSSESNQEVGSLMAEAEDNYSDVLLPMSANVSGRGTPSISGRDTPLSSHQEPLQSETGDGVDTDVPSTPGGIPQARRPHPNLPETAHKENRTDIQERFGKFEIPHPPHGRQRGDETHSLVSDCWSTDVLASDSEYGGLVDRGEGLPDIVPDAPPDIARLDLIAEESNLLGARGGESMEDRSETWSVDALASDSEDKEGQDGEQDLDDTGSDSASAPFALSDMNQSARPGEAPPEITFGSQSDSAAPKILRRQSSGSSFYSRSDIGDSEIGDRETLNIDDGGISGPTSSASLAGLATAFGGGSGANQSSILDSPVPPMNASDKTPTINNTIGDQMALGGMGGRGGKNLIDGSSAFSKYSQQHNGGFSLVASQFSASDSIRGLDSVAATGNTPTSATPTSYQAGTNIMWRQENDAPHDDSDKSEHPMSRQSLGRLSFILGAGDFLPGADKSRSNPFSGPQGKSMESSSDLDDGRTRPTIDKGAILRTRKLGNDPEKDDSIAGKGRGHKILKGINSFKSTLTGNLKTVRRSHTDHQISEISGGVQGLSVSSSAHDLNQQLTDAESLQTAEEETSDDILAKYRIHKASTGNAMGDDYASGPLLTDGKNRVSQDSPAARFPSVRAVEEASRNGPFLDSSSGTSGDAFADAKRKLRVVLSSVDVQCLSINDSVVLAIPKQYKESCELMQFLQFLLAEALNSQDKILTSQLRETIRCLESIDSRGIRKLIRSLREEYRRRSSYVSYLHQSKLKLLQSKAYLNQLNARINREQTLSGECLVEVCARLFLETRDRDMHSFLAEFAMLGLQDEKTELVDNFLKTLYNDMKKDAMWRNANPDQVERAQLCIERSVMAQVYIQALYPNGDADVSRDQVLHDHMKKLSLIITPDHKDLKIRPEYYGESPWPSAQAEIAIINAYKTPRDKLECVIRCCETLIYLLQMAKGGSNAAADDLVPLLLFVIIKANPPSLMSTIQYVEGFYRSRMEGSQSYYWCQFCSAVEFIKTMDY